MSTWALILLLFAQGADYGAERRRMVDEQIAARGVRDARVLDAMRTIPRHEFIPEEARRWAYDDSPVPIGHRATISQPYIVGVMSELLQLGPGMRVLEVGTGSGYQAAVLSRLAGEVFTIEIVPELARSAADTLARLGFRNVHVRTGDGYKGWPEEAPFDRIILTAAPPEIPDALIDQLKPGGLLVAPVGASSQELIVVTKDKSGRISRKSVLDVRFVPMVKGR